MGIAEAWVDRLISPSRLFPEEQAELYDIQRAVWHPQTGSGPSYDGGLYYLWNRSCEIAYATDCPWGTVKSRLHYGRAQLRQALANLQLQTVAKLQPRQSNEPLPVQQRYQSTVSATCSKIVKILN